MLFHLLLVKLSRFLNYIEEKRKNADIWYKAQRNNYNLHIYNEIMNIEL